MPTDPTNGAGYDPAGHPYLWVISPDGDREVALELDLPRLMLLGYVREDGLPIPAPAPGSLAAVLAAIAALPNTYARGAFSIDPDDGSIVLTIGS